MVWKCFYHGLLDIPIFESANNAFTAWLSLNKSENFAEFVRVRSSSLGSIDEILCLRALLDREDMTTEEIAQVLQRTVREAQKVLETMEKKLMIHKTISNRFALAAGVRTDIKTIYRRDQLDMFN